MKILKLTLRLKKVEGNMLERKMIKTLNLSHAVSLMKEHNETCDYVYSWNDFNLKDDSFGRGIVYAEKYHSGNSKVKIEKYQNRLSKPPKFPNLYNGFTTRLMCNGFYFLETFKSSSSLTNQYNAAFPIYGKEIYYYLFGKRGFREYQVLFSWHTWQLAADEIRKLISKTNLPVTLGSLKLFSGKPHYLSFSGDGVCITINVANNLMSKDFFQSLDEITIKYNGRINLCKDSRTNVELVKQLFPEYELFKQRINTFDTKRIFVSDLRNRIQI